jgi:TonB family protein
VSEPRRKGTLAASTGAFDAEVSRESTTRHAARSTGGAFGDASETAASAPASRAAASQGSFGDVSTATPNARASHAAEAASDTVAAEILDKPRPAYTEEARRLAIEGEVLIEALLGASGEIQIERLVRGLGHGLDENAMAAARRIRFRPARRAGLAVDSRVLVHISFQLAY